MPTRRFLLKLYSNICDPPQGPKDSVIMQRWFWIIGWIPTSLAVLGNALVIWFITTRRRLRKTVNRFIVSLAVADFCIGSFLFPALFICERRRVFCTVHHERVISTSLSFLVHASAVNLCAMTADRYIAITLPLKYITYITPERSIRIITAAWVFPAVVWILYTALIHQFGASATAAIYVINIPVKCVFEILPAILLIVATIHMFVIVRRHKKEISTLVADLRFNNRTSEDGQSVVRKSPEASSATVVGVVVLGFVLCYCVENYFSFCLICPLILVDMVLLFLVINAAANPLAYAFLKKDIKREMQALFKRTGMKKLAAIKEKRVIP